MMVDVPLLPDQALSVQSFRARGERPYLEAHEELRAAVATALAESGGLPDLPLRGRVALTIICYVGGPARDGRYRPERVHSLHYVLDPIYRALLDCGVVGDMADVYAIRTVLVRGSSHEGFRVRVDPLTLPAEVA